MDINVVMGALMFLGIFGVAGYFVLTEDGHRSRPVVPEYIPGETSAEYRTRVHTLGMKKKPVRKTITAKTGVSRGTLPEWFCVEGIKISPAEQLIIDELKKYKVRWYREIAFKEFPSSKWGYYRYDFMIPSKRLIIEYDGVVWHKAEEKQVVDKKKELFCKKHGITVVRLNKSHYYKMPTTVAQLMKSHGIPLA